MTKFRFLFLASALTLSLTSNVQATEPQMGRCLMGLCVWTKILNKSLVKSQNGASLYKVQIQEGIAPHMDEGGRCFKNTSINKNSFFHNKIGWFKPSEEYVFCSNKLPAVVSATVKIIPMQREMVNYSSANAVSVYVPVCHNISVNEFFAESFQRDHYYHDSGIKTISLTKQDALDKLLTSEASLK